MRGEKMKNSSIFEEERRIILAAISNQNRQTIMATKFYHAIFVLYTAISDAEVKLEMASSLLPYEEPPHHGSRHRIM